MEQGDNLFCAGQKVTSQNYRDGITRIQQGYPEMNKKIKKMLYDFKKNNELEKAFLFFIGKCEFDEEYSGFLTRELNRGWL